MRGQLAAGALVDLAVGAQDLLGALERPGDQPAVDGRADLVQRKGERRDHAEVGARAADRPEQVGVLVAAGGADLAVGGDDLDREQVVDRPAEAARQIAEAAAERQARDADLREEAQRRGEAVALRGVVDVPEREPAPTVAVLASGSTSTVRSADMSIVSPPSTSAVPAML